MQQCRRTVEPCALTLTLRLLFFVLKAADPIDPDIPPNSVGEQLSLALQRTCADWTEGQAKKDQKELDDLVLAKVV